MQPFKKILVPLDFSGLSEGALPIAKQMADADTEIHLLHVNQPVMVYAHAGGTLPPASPRSGPSAAQLKSSLQDLARKMDVGSDNLVQKVVDGAAPAESIVEYANENDIELIVMTTHGTTGLMRLLMGSVAEHVVRKAKCPVLTLKVEGEND